MLEFIQIEKKLKVFKINNWSYEQYIFQVEKKLKLLLGKYGLGNEVQFYPKKKT